MTIHSFHEHNLVSYLDPIAAQVGANSSWVQPFVDGVGADRAVFMLVTGAIASNDIVLALWEATSSVGAGAAAISGATTTIANGTSGQIATVEIGPGALTSSVNSAGNSPYSYVQARVTSAASQLWGLIYIRHNLRYPGPLTQDATYVAQVHVTD